MENQFPPATRLACYPRVSTEEQKQRGLSIEDQAAALQAWADRNGIKQAVFYNDAGNSARKPYHKRPAMVRLLEDVRPGKSTSLSSPGWTAGSGISPNITRSRRFSTSTG